MSVLIAQVDCLAGRRIAVRFHAASTPAHAVKRAVVRRRPLFVPFGDDGVGFFTGPADDLRPFAGLTDSICLNVEVPRR